MRELGTVTGERELRTVGPVAPAPRRMPASAWRRLRLAVLRRDGWTCQRCGRHAPLEVHHVNQVPTDNRPENLTTLCRRCHIEAHRRPVAPDVAAWRELLRNM